MDKADTSALVREARRRADIANLDGRDFDRSLFNRLATALSNALEAERLAVEAERIACAIDGTEACECDKCASLVWNAIRARAQQEAGEENGG